MDSAAQSNASGNAEGCLRNPNINRASDFDSLWKLMMVARSGGPMGDQKGQHELEILIITKRVQALEKLITALRHGNAPPQDIDALEEEAHIATVAWIGD